MTSALVEPRFGPELGRLPGAVAFGIGVVFLVQGRTERFSENLFDPVAAAIAEKGRGVWRRVLSLWATVLVLNLVGGAVLVAILLIDGALPEGAGHTLDRIAEEIAAKPPTATLARAILAGALVALLSYMLNAVDSVVARIVVAFMVGFFLAVGPFDHVAVSVLHLLFGAWHFGSVTTGDVLSNLALSAVATSPGGCLSPSRTRRRSGAGDRPPVAGP